MLHHFLIVVGVYCSYYFKDTVMILFVGVTLEGGCVLVMGALLVNVKLA